MRGLVSTAAARAWVVVVVLGLLTIGGVIGLGLIPRLGAGQQVVDAAHPALTDDAVRGEVAGAKLLGQYVDLVDAIVTSKREIGAQSEDLVALIARRAGVSKTRARAFLRRTAPHTEALLRAAPLSAVASERGRLTQLLSSTLNVGPEDLQDEFARTFPHLFQALSELPNVTGGWYDIPGLENMTRFDGKRVRAMPGMRDYLRDDLVATVDDEQDRFEYLAAWGGIGYIPYLLAILAVIVTLFGALQVRRSASHPQSKLAWGVVAAVGAVILLVVGALQFFQRLSGADKTITHLAPAFQERRVAGLRAGTDVAVQAVRFGDPLMTRAGGAAAEYPKLLTFVSERSGLSRAKVRDRLRSAAPRTAALLDALPLSAVAAEVPRLTTAIGRKFKAGDPAVLALLVRRAPTVAQALLAVGPVTASWNAIPGTQGLERFDGVSPVRSAPQFATYLDADVVPVLETQREHFDTLEDAWPPVDLLPPIVTGIGALLLIYGLVMMFRVTTPPPRY